MGSESGSKRSGSGVLTMVVFASAVAILLGLELRFNKHHLEEPFSIISVGDMTDLLTPYVLIVCYWGMYLDGLRFSGADGHALESPKTLLFILSSMIWCQGHALHNAANSIANAFEASGLHIRSPPHPSIVLPHIPRLGATVAHVADWYDERFSHILWVVGICALESFAVFPHLTLPILSSPPLERATLSPWKLLVLYAASLLYTAAFWGTCIEGGTVAIGIIFCAFVLHRIARAVHVWASPCLFFFGSSAATMLAAFTLYAIVWHSFLFEHGRLPEFSEVTDLFAAPE